MVCGTPREQMGLFSWLRAELCFLGVGWWRAGCSANLDPEEETEKETLEGSGCDSRATEVNPFSSLSFSLSICKLWISGCSLNTQADDLLVYKAEISLTQECIAPPK